MPPKKKQQQKKQQQQQQQKGKNKKQQQAAAAVEEEETGPSKKEVKRLERLKRDAMRKERLRRKYGDKEWDDDMTRFQRQLYPSHLFVRDVAGDGNCLFRALSDQLFDTANQHEQTRSDVVRFIEEHREDFEPFVEDDEPFDRYVACMRRPGTWGGNLELQAASCCYHANIYVHQLGLPRWDIINFAEPDVRVLQLSYHDGMHWSSVRDISTATPRERARNAAIALEVAAAQQLDGGAHADVLQAQQQQQKEEEKPIEPTKNEIIVLQQTGTDDVYLVRKVLEECGGNVDDAVTKIVEEQARKELGYEMDWREPEAQGYQELGSDTEAAEAAEAKTSTVGVLEGTVLEPPTMDEKAVMEATGTSDMMLVRKAMRLCHGQMDEAVNLILTDPELCNQAAQSPQTRPAKKEPQAAAAEISEVERQIMSLTEEKDVDVVRAALAATHNNIDDAVMLIITQQAGIGAPPQKESATPTTPAPKESATTVAKTKTTSATTAPKETTATPKQAEKPASKAEKTLQDLDQAVAGGHPLSKKQKRQLKKAPKLREIAAAARKKPRSKQKQAQAQTSSSGAQQQPSSIRI